MSTTDERSVEDIESYIEWLTAFRHTEGGVFRSFLRYYGLKEHAWWELMKSMGTTSGPEFGLCKKMARPLRKKWREMQEWKALPVKQLDDLGPARQTAYIDCSRYNSTDRE